MCRNVLTWIVESGTFAAVKTFTVTSETNQIKTLSYYRYNPCYDMLIESFQYRHEITVEFAGHSMRITSDCGKQEQFFINHGDLGMIKSPERHFEIKDFEISESLPNDGTRKALVAA